MLLGCNEGVNEGIELGCNDGVIEGVELGCNEGSLLGWRDGAVDIEG
jgi:hypothetical protein